MKLSDVPPGELAKLGLDPYEDNARLKKIAIIVLVIHCAVIVVPLVVILFMSIFQEPEPEVIRATLVIPKGESLDVPANSDPEAGSPTPSESTPEPEPPPAAPEPEPEPEPAPEPEPEPVTDTPPPPTVESKIPPLEEVKEKPKPEEKKKPEPPKEKPKDKPKEKPKEKPKKRTAEDIRRDRQKNKNKTNKTIEKKNREAEIRAARAAAAAANARKQALQKAAGILNPSGKGKPGTPGKKFGTWDGKEGVVNTQAYVSYVDKLTALLKMRWKQPSSMEVGGKQLSVTLTLDIAADGTLKAKDFKPSGNKYMDQSARDLLNNLKVVPKPPCAMVQEVTLRVQDN